MVRALPLSDATSKARPADLGTGTPGVGKYLDGGGAAAEWKTLPAGGLTEDQADALERVPAVVKVSAFSGAVSVAVNSGGFPTGATTNSTAAILASIAALHPGDTWVIDGNYCHRDTVIDLNVDGVTVKRENNGRLIATTTYAGSGDDAKASTVKVSGANVTTEALVLRAHGVNARRSSYERDMKLVVTGANFAGYDIDVDGSWASGIALIGALNYRLYGPKVRNTRADGITEIGGCFNGVTSNPDIADTGDDGMSSHSFSGTRSNRGGKAVGGSVTRTGARGLSVLGGEFTYEDIAVSVTQVAAMYVCAETNAPAGLSQPVSSAVFRRITTNDVCKDPNTSHAPMTVVSYQAEGGIDYVLFEDITTGPTAAGGFGGGFAILNRYNNGRIGDVEFRRITAAVDQGTEVFLLNGVPEASYRIEQSKRANNTAIPDAGLSGAVGSVDPTTVVGYVEDADTLALPAVTTVGGKQVAQIVITEDGTAAALRWTVDGVEGSIPLTVGAFVPDEEPAGGDDWATFATRRWVRSGLPTTGTDLDGLHWTAASSSTPDLVGTKVGSGGTVTTEYGAVHLKNENSYLAATLPAALVSEPGEGPAAVLMRFARLGPFDPADGRIGYFLQAAGFRFGVAFDASRGAGQKLVWAVQLASDGTPVATFPVTSGIDQSGYAGGGSPTAPHVLVNVLITVILDGASSKLFCNGVQQGTFSALAGTSTALNFSNYEGGSSLGRGLWAMSDVLIFPSDATPDRVAAAAATIPAGA